MYLRHTTRTKDGKTHVYWRLVRSVRRGRKVVQETVAQLGELDAEGRARAAVLARKISGRANSQGNLFEANAPIEAAAVRLEAVRLERSRSFGAVWLSWVLWQALKFDELLSGLLPRGREAVSWADVIAILVIGRLCEPSSELHVAERWYRTTALEDLLGVQSESVYEERLYRALDRLLPHKQAIEAHLVKRLGELFELDYDLLLYDVTSTYFEGVADAAIAKRGYSRDHRPDCVQVNIALVVTREGMPLGYEIFPGNRTDVTTVEEIVSGMEARFGKANRVWVMDRGMVSAENLAWLNQTGRRYVIGTPKAELRRWARQIEDQTDWRHIREDVEVKVCRGPEGQETFLLCRSASRVDKERAMHERFGKHIEEGLDRLGRRIERSKNPLDRGAIERQIGRLLGRNSRAAGGFSIVISEDDIIEADLVDCMVALPGQLFYSTQIPVCLWFLARNKKNGRFRDRRGETLFIDARKLGSMTDRTFGNLTLLTQPLNSSVSNSAFEIKKPEILKNSALALNRYFQDKDVWDEDLITTRGEMLFAHASERWPYPATSGA